MHLQTQQEVKLRMTGMALQVVRTDGFLALYNGLSASLCRQVRAYGLVLSNEKFFLPLLLTSASWVSEQASQGLVLGLSPRKEP